MIVEEVASFTPMERSYPKWTRLGH